MHPAVLDWVTRWSTGSQYVLDLGGRDVNGTCRPVFPHAFYETVDITDGPGVDHIGDARTWRSGDPAQFDTVLCTEVFEHLPGWQNVCDTAYHELRPGGRFIVTCAGPGRPPHSGRDAVPTPEPDEHYANVSPEELAKALTAAGFEMAACRQHGLDTQALAIKPYPSPIPPGAAMVDDPFPNVIVDGLWPDDLLDAVVAEFPDLTAGWRRYGNDNEHKLEGGPDLWGPAIHILFATLRSPDTIARLEDLTGIRGLVMETVGGGYHLIPPGAGRLAVHTDFNRSPHSNLYRRLNCLVYLNRDWRDPGGRLELWPDGDGDPTVVAPEFNRIVIFETSDRSWHGHPQPADRWRLSVAAYYFSPDPPPGYREDHSTVWRSR